MSETHSSDRPLLTDKGIERLGKIAGERINTLPENIVGESAEGRVLQDQIRIDLAHELISMTEGIETIPEGTVD